MTLSLLFKARKYHTQFIYIISHTIDIHTTPCKQTTNLKIMASRRELGWMHPTDIKAQAAEENSFPLTNLDVAEARNMRSNENKDLLSPSSSRAHYFPRICQKRRRLCQTRRRICTQRPRIRPKCSKKLLAYAATSIGAKRRGIGRVCMRSRPNAQRSYKCMLWHGCKEKKPLKRASKKLLVYAVV